MSTPGLLTRTLGGFLATLQPLRDAVASPDTLGSFLRKFGWDLIPGDLERVGSSLGDLSSLPTDPSTLSLDQLTSQLTSAATVIRGIADSGTPTTFAQTFARELLDYLVYIALAQGSPKVFTLLHFAGVLSEADVAADAASGRSGYTARMVNWDRLSSLTEKPYATVLQNYGWGGQFDGAALLRSVGMLVRAFGGRASLQPADRHLISQYHAPGTPDAAGTPNLILTLPQAEASVTSGPAVAEFDIALLAMPIPPRADAPAPVDGLAVMPVITGQAKDTIHLSDTISVKLDGDFLARPVRAEIHPDRSFVRAAAGDVHIDASARLDATAPPGAPWIALGDPGGSRLQLSAAHATLALRGELDRDADLSVEIGIDAGSLVIDFSQSDGFLQDTLAKQPTSSPLSFTLSWSSQSGFSFGKQPRLQLSLPVHQTLGNFALLSDVELGIGPGPGTSTALDLTVSGSTSIGPVAVSVAGVGVRLLLETRTDAQPPGNLGNVDVDFGFKPPSGIGLSVDAEGVLTGGGFLSHDPATATYAGAMQLSLHDELTLTGFGLITTKLPDGSAGFSLLVFIIADGFEPIELGFGFMLQSIGGMLGINRTFDADVIRAGLHTDALASLLLPRDPVGNAAALTQALATAFPAQRGSYLLGLLARITWFTPTLVQMDLALILELGTRSRLLALGRVSALLPSRNNDLIRLNMDVMGVLDFDAGTVSADAVLVDSRLAHQFPITGSAALRGRWAGAGDAGASFVLAVGGVNPRFTPPDGFPALERVAIALCAGSNPRLVCDAYMAITANTVQFGARASLYAEALGFSIAGDMGFDALITLLPPHFIVDFHASVQLKRGSHNLFKVTVDGTLEGPLPLRLAAKARFEILWVSFSVHFNFTLAAGDPSQTQPSAVALSDELTRTLADPTSWTTQRTPGLAHGVALRSLPPGPALVLDPLGQLVVRQQLVPLNTDRDVDTFGGAPVAGPRRFQVAATLNGHGGTTLTEAFAPARYFIMSDDDKLAAPSFELMAAGVVLGSDAAVFDRTTIVPAPLSYASLVVDVPPATSAASLTRAAPLAAAAVPARYTMPVAALKSQRTSGAAALAPVRRLGRARFRNRAAQPAATLRPTRWNIERASDGSLAPANARLTTWSEYRTALAALNRGGAQWLMVPVHELPA